MPSTQWTRSAYCRSASPTSKKRKSAAARGYCSSCWANLTRCRLDGGTGPNEVLFSTYYAPTNTLKVAFGLMSLGSFYPVISMPWVRPASVPVGQVWSRFTGRELNGQPAKNYQIRDMEDRWKKPCLDLMKETFLRDEPLCDLLEINKDPVSIATIVANWESFVAQNMSLACFTEVDGDPDELVGFNITLVKSRDDKEEDFDKVQGESWRKLLRTLITAEEMKDVFQHYQVDKYLTSSGLTVLPEHRGQNIGARLFAARKPLCLAMGIEATATVFTATTSQVLAGKCGYEVLAELNYSDMKQYGIDLEYCKTPTAKLMGTKFC